MQIRPTTADDLPAICAVHIQTWKVAYQGLVPQWHLDGLSAEKRLPKARAWFANPELISLVVVEGEQVWGFIDCGPTRDADLPSTVGEIYAVYLHPDRWNRGYGRALMDAALARLRAAGFTTVVLWAFAANTRADRFYQAAGFIRGTGPEARKIATFRDGTEVAEVRFQRGP